MMMFIDSCLGGMRRVISAWMPHPVQGSAFDACFGLLTFVFSSIHMVSKDGLESKHGRFCQ
jgi:hypothetical protein